VHPSDRGPGSILSNWIPFQVGGSYRYFTGSLAYVLHRVTGLALLVYLFFHIQSITEASNADPSQYDVLMRRFQEPDFKIGEVLLYGALLFHGINGMRILLVDFVVQSTHWHKKVFWMFLIRVVVLLLLGAIPLILHTNVQPILRDTLPGVVAGGGH
jgi:succinate dehydrogenase / fumarate reductase, cytochrome b subunit